MLEFLQPIVQRHDLSLVVLAALICLFAVYTTFNLMERARGAKLWPRVLAMLGAAIVAGTGIWATNFVALLAFRPGMPIGFNIGLTGFALFAAVILSGLGLAISLKPRFVLIGGALLGQAIIAMHYLSMAALSAPAFKYWNLNYVTASMVLAWVLGALSLLTAQSSHKVAHPKTVRALSIALFVLAIFGLHFTAMAGLDLVRDPLINVWPDTTPPEWLAVAITAIMLVISGIAHAASLVDQRFAAAKLREAEKLRQYVIDLEHTKIELQNTAASLSLAVAEASAANQAKSLFLATMSHELRTPLNAIIGFSEILKTGLLGPLTAERQKEYISSIYDSGKHLLALINDVLDISKCEAGSLELVEDVVDISALASYCIQIMTPAAEKAGVHISKDMTGELGMRGDERRLTQVLLNLISNAIKFTPAGGHVNVIAHCDARGISIAVRDTGIGMSRDEIPKALERFGQIDSRLARKHDGTGLGLPLAKKLTEAHGGTLDVESVPGKGTTVTLLFPPERSIAAIRAA